MYTKNLTVREMYASISATSVIVDFFRKGLEMDNDRLAVSAMEELLRRGDSDYVVSCLSEAFQKNQVRLGSVMSTLIANSLVESARTVDPFLSKYGKAILSGKCEGGPREWAMNG